MSGLEAVKRIVETEEQARRMLEEYKRKSQEIVSQARLDSDSTRKKLLEEAERTKNAILDKAQEDGVRASEEIRKSAEETIKRLRKNVESNKKQTIIIARATILGE